MVEGITCYERDETLCEDGMCLRLGCRLRNDRLSAQQREPVVRVKELEWADADEGMCTKWRACALGGHYELVALDGDGGGLAVNFYWGRPLSFWFIQGEPDEWGPTGPKMFPTLDEAKAAAQRDYEVRILSALDM